MSRSTRPHKSRLGLRSHNETALPARVTPGDDQRSPAKSCSLFDGITTRDSRRRQCGKPDRDPVRITTWLAGQGRRSPPPSRGGNSATVFHRVSRPRGSTVLMGNSLAEMLSTLSWLAHYGFWVNRHTLRVEFTYESRMRALGIQALEGARMKSFLRTG